MGKTPLAELPVELLSKIFVCSLSPPADLPLDIPLFCRPPQQLLLVSHKWRVIALGTPELWQSLDLKHTAGTKPRAGSDIEKHFSHAGSLPLDLRVQLSPGGFLKGRFFLPFWGQLRSVDISGDTELQSKIVRMMLDDAPMLVSASFEIADPPPFGRFSVVFPKTELLHLRRFTAKFRRHERGNGEMAISEFFETLVLPRLEELCLESLDLAYDDELPETLVDLQERSQFPLRYLHIARIEWNDSCLIRFLHSVPTLKHLHLQTCTADKRSFLNLFNMLQYIPHSDDNVLPNLTKIEVNEEQMIGWESGDDDDDLVMRCVESRWWPDGSSPHRQEGLRRLADVVVRWTDGDRYAGQLRAQHRNRAERLRAGGMNLRLVYPTLIS